MNHEVNGSLDGDSNIKGALCYIPLIGWILCIFFILTEKDDRNVRFNALQSLLLLFLYIGISLILSMFSGLISITIYAGFIAALLGNLIAPLYIFLSIFLIYKSYIGERFRLPRLGLLSEKNL